MTRTAALACLAAAILACARPAPSGDRGAVETLDEILRSRDDNDPRLDSAFNALSPETKRLFREKYRKIAPERRNARGTVVHLLGRNLREPQDWEFLREVVSEPPCLSLTDCSRKAPPDAGEAAAGDEVTLAYPALTALKQAEHALEGPDAFAARPQALSVIEAGRGSRAPAVVRMAERLRARFSRR